MTLKINIIEMKITKRDIKFFILGIATLFIIETIYDWKNSVEAFNDGLQGRPFESKLHNK